MTKPLTPQQLELLEFCKHGKTVESIAKRFGYGRNNVYPRLATLQRLGLLRRDGYGTTGKVAIFVTIGQGIDQIEAPADSGGTDLSAILARAHDPFNLRGIVTTI